MLMYPKVLKQTLAIGLPGYIMPITYSVMIFSPGVYIKTQTKTSLFSENDDLHQQKEPAMFTSTNRFTSPNLQSQISLSILSYRPESSRT